MNSQEQSLYSNLPPEVYAMGKMHLEGNVTPHAWYDHIKFENGKVDLVSITILSEIVFWYRPIYDQDEITGKTIGIRKRFKSDALQKSKQSLADRFGLTERQVKESLVRLEDLGLITREYRTIFTESKLKMGNVLFIKIHPAKIEEISFNQCQPCDVETSEGQHLNVRPPTFKRQTNTHNTTHNTTKIRNTPAAAPFGAIAASAACASSSNSTNLIDSLRGEPAVSTSDNISKVPSLSLTSAQDVALFLFENLKKNNPVQKKPNLEKWVKEIDIIIRKDERSPEQLKQFISWAFASKDKFWSTILQSPKTLRDQFDKGWATMQYKPKSEQATDQVSTNKKWAQELESFKSKTCKEKGVRIEALNNYIEITHLRSSAPSFILKYTEKGFLDQVESYLRKSGLI